MGLGSQELAEPLTAFPGRLTRLRGFPANRPNPRSNSTGCHRGTILLQRSGGEMFFFGFTQRVDLLIEPALFLGAFLHFGCSPIAGGFLFAQEGFGFGNSIELFLLSLMQGLDLTIKLPLFS